MMRSYRSILAVVFSAVALAACGSDGGSTTGDVAKGETLVTTNACGSCHTGSKGTLAGGDTQFSGVYGANITPDMATGIGGWTDDQIKAAIKTGVDDDGKELCASMTRFSTLSDQDLTDIVAYLRSIEAVNNAVEAGTCTP